MSVPDYVPPLGTVEYFKLIQLALMAAGEDVGQSLWGKEAAIDGIPGRFYDAALLSFQGRHKLPPTGIADDETELALFGAPLPDAGTPGPAALPPAKAPIIPDAWMPASDITGMVIHWTAGASRATDFDRAHYHLLVDGDGALKRGIPTIADNSRSAFNRARYAAHTLNANGGRIGLSLAGMANATFDTSGRFHAGPAPLTPRQWEILPALIAQLAARYRIKVTRQNVLSHSEVQPTLGINQRGKIDICRLPWEPDAYLGQTVGAASIAIGDRVRSAALKLL